MTNRDLYFSLINNAKATILKVHVAESRTIYIDIKRPDGEKVLVRESTHLNINQDIKNGVIPMLRANTTVNVGDGCLNTGIKILAVWLGYPEKLVSKVNLKEDKGQQKLLTSFFVKEN